MCLVLEKDLPELVKEEKKNEWEAASSYWFVKNHEDAWDLRCPGKMKLEWSTTNGAICWYVSFPIHNFKNRLHIL